MNRTFVLVAALVVAGAGVPATASASVIAVDESYFGAGSTLTTFDGVSGEVVGLAVDGLVFDYSAGPGQLDVSDGGPGMTNHVTPNFILSVGDDKGVLSIALPSLTSAFGFGYALLSAGPVPDGATIALFNGATPLGMLSYDADPDPLFAGGFAGIASSAAFDLVQVTFPSSLTVAFALDDIRTLPATVPEPALMALVGVALTAAGARRWARGRG